MNLYALASQLRFGLVEPSWTFFFQIANTIILFLVLKKIMFKPVTEFMEKRESEIKDEFEKAELENTAAEKLITEYKEKLSLSEEKGRNIVNAAILKAEAKSSEIIKDTEHEVSLIKEKAQNDIDNEKIKAINSLKDEIADMAILAASRVIEEDVDSNKHKTMIDKFINEVGDTRWQN
jgi:F-type H+-transporting ATPase subunit b